MKFRYPKGILGGILKYGINPTAITHAWLAVFAQRQEEKQRALHAAREQAQKTEDTPTEKPDDES